MLTLTGGHIPGCREGPRQLVSRWHARNSGRTVDLKDVADVKKLAVGVAADRELQAGMCRDETKEKRQFPRVNTA